MCILTSVNDLWLEVFHMFENAKELIKEYKMIQDGDIVGVATSGGKDSMALLCFLVELSQEKDFEIVAIHVDHCLRENSNDDAEFVLDFCKEHGIRAYKFKVDAAKIAKEKSESIEMGARDARYGVFDALIRKGVVSKIAIAHHKQDQAETILMHLFRGSGVAGMKGMVPVRDYYIRPFLSTDRSEIEQYLNVNCISNIEDETNFEDNYQRNRLRNKIMPEILKVWPNAINSVISLSKDCVDDDKYISSQIIDDALILEDKVVKIPASYFLYPSAIISRLVFKAIKRIGIMYDIERKHIASIVDLALKGENGKKIDLPMELTVHKEYDYITLTNKHKEKIVLNVPFKCGEFEIEGLGKIKVRRISPSDFVKTENNLMIDAKKLPKGAIWRFREDGDIFEKFNGGTKKLKSFLADKKVPQRIRNILPVLAVDSEIYAIAGIQISEAVRVEDGVKYAYEIILTKN